MLSQNRGNQAVERLAQRCAGLIGFRHQFHNVVGERQSIQRKRAGYSNRNTPRTMPPTG